MDITNQLSPFCITNRYILIGNDYYDFGLVDTFKKFYGKDQNITRKLIQTAVNTNRVHFCFPITSLAVDYVNYIELMMYKRETLNIFGWMYLKHC